MSVTEARKVTLNDYRAETPTWCPGCGDFGVLRGLQRALVDLQIEPHRVLVVSGIGCSGKLSSYIGTYGFHGLHGRTLPVAQAAKLANPELTVIAVGGDGDGYGIGVGHLVHAIRRNVDVTYVVMNNDVYGLTVGQTAPTTPLGRVTRSSPFGSSDYPLSPLGMALGLGASFVAQGFSGHIDHLAVILRAAIQHRGFSLVNVFSPCVTFNEEYGYDYLRQRLVDVDADPSYRRLDRATAAAKLAETGGLVEGILFEDPERVAYDELLPQFAHEPLTRRVAPLKEDERQSILEAFSLTGE
ncbi:MAG: thiamine pyrophosphate-dependent enzyme [Bacillota bacterium]|nr:thiamine pyrophosphate-dependent enzyme [Bacillota bacterium]